LGTGDYRIIGKKHKRRPKTREKYMDGRSVLALVWIFIIVFMACGVQAATPVSEPGSRFVWEPGENLTFTWTKANFDGFYYDAQSRAGKESLTIKLDNLTDRWITQDNMVYSTTFEQVTARYSPFGEYAVIGFLGQKYLAGFPEGKSNITSGGGINPRSLYKILIDENANYTLTRESALILNEGYFLKVKDVNAASSQITLSLMREGINIDTKTIDIGKDYVYEIRDRPVIAVHIDSILKENETVSAAITGIFQVSEQYTSVNERDIFGVMKIIKASEKGITMGNFLPVDLKRGSIIEIIGNIKLKVADSDTPRVHLYSDCDYENNEQRGATGSNELSSWDGMNYAGFWYDVDSGNYSESLEITNITARMIPQGGLTYTSHMIRMLYPVTRIKGKKPAGTDGSYLTYSLWGNNYAVRSNGLAKILVGQEDCIYDKKTLPVRYNEFKGDIWELGEGYNLAAKSVNFNKYPYNAQLLFSRNGVALDEVWLQHENIYGYALPGENGTPKLITYLDAIFSGTEVDMIQLRYTWFVSDNVTQIKKGDRFGVFNVTVVEPDRISLTNMEPIELKAGSSINLFGNLSFFVENSDELRFYPTNIGGTQVLPEEVTVIMAPDIPEVTTPTGTFLPVAVHTEAAGFEFIISITIILAYIAGRKLR
jgi:S-layer protein (TIGR01567 family)